jgi:influenza virus NS1A-binding protein
MLCKQVLCIDCILNDGHKSHEINSIEKAVGIEKNLFYEFLKRSMEIEDKIKAQNMDIDNHFLMVRNQANNNRDTISKIFNNVRQLINQRENELKSKIADVLDDEETYLNEKKDKLNNQLVTINEFKRQSRIIDSNSDITVLQNSQKLYNISQKALEKHCAVALKDPFVNVKEDIELMHI